MAYLDPGAGHAEVLERFRSRGSTSAETKNMHEDGYMIGGGGLLNTRRFIRVLMFEHHARACYLGTKMPKRRLGLLHPHDQSGGHLSSPILSVVRTSCRFKPPGHSVLSSVARKRTVPTGHQDFWNELEAKVSVTGISF